MKYRYMIECQNCDNEIPIFVGYDLILHNNKMKLQFFLLMKSHIKGDKTP